MPVLASVTSLSTRACGLWRPDSAFPSLYLAREGRSGPIQIPPQPQAHAGTPTPIQLGGGRGWQECKVGRGTLVCEGMVSRPYLPGVTTVSGGRLGHWSEVCSSTSCLAPKPL